MTAASDDITLFQEIRRVKNRSFLWPLWYQCQHAEHRKIMWKWTFHL